MTTEHVFLVAVSIVDADRDKAQGRLQSWLSRPGVTSIAEWWIAEDDRTDGSDNDSAVFVKPGAQVAAATLLNIVGLTGACNIPADRPGVIFDGPSEA